MANRSFAALGLLTLILSGCAAPPVTSVPATQQPARSAKLINAAPGEYDESSGKLNALTLGSAKAIRVVMQAHRLQPSKQWAPTIIFCVKDKNIGSSYCLNTYATPDEKRMVAELVYKESGSADVVKKRLPFDLEPSGSHYLDILFSQDRLFMIIDDHEFFDHPLPAWLEDYWFSCSSIICSVELTSPPPPHP